MVVVRREVDRRKAAARELRRERGVAAEQSRGRVFDALGLEQGVAGDRPGLAHHAIGWTKCRARICIEAARACAQPAREEIIEAHVVAGLGTRGFAEFDGIPVQEDADQE